MQAGWAQALSRNQCASPYPTRCMSRPQAESHKLDPHPEKRSRSAARMLPDASQKGRLDANYSSPMVPIFRHSPRQSRAKSCRRPSFVCKQL
jgi:hypothetical protein